jgi:hypothetical protein
MASKRKPARRLVRRSFSEGGSLGTGGLSHVDAHGRIKMVDVGEKAVTAREAVARGTVSMSATARRLIRTGAVKKGDPLQAARLAGIMAAKRTSELIPHIRRRRHDADAHRLRNRSARSHVGADRRRDGSVDGGRRGGADALRHGQGCRQEHGDR